jgi:hypothetical protein
MLRAVTGQVQANDSRCHWRFLVRRVAGVVVILLLLGMTSCMAHRNFRARDERITHYTAYTVPKRETRIGAGLVGRGVGELGVNFGVTHGVTSRFQVGANVAHAAIGVLNVGIKGTFVDRGRFGLGGSARLLRAQPKNIWLLPEEAREPIADIDLIVIPIKLHSSYPLAPWTSLQLGVGYTHSEIVGPIHTDAALIEGGLGARVVRVEPGVHFYMGGRVALVMSASLAPYAWGRANLAAESEISEGVIAGVRSSEWRPLDFDQTARYLVGVEMRFGRRKFTHMQLYGVRGALSRAGILPPFVPGVNFYWRI